MSPRLTAAGFSFPDPTSVEGKGVALVLSLGV
jgi:hypothetical protein